MSWPSRMSRRTVDCALLPPWTGVEWNEMCGMKGVELNEFLSSALPGGDRLLLPFSHTFPTLPRSELQSRVISNIAFKEFLEVVPEVRG